MEIITLDDAVSSQLSQRSRRIYVPVMACEGRGDLLYRTRSNHSGRRYATAARPFFATSINSFNDAPWGCFSPRSHWLTKLVLTFR